MNCILLKCMWEIKISVHYSHKITYSKQPTIALFPQCDLTTHSARSSTSGWIIISCALRLRLFFPASLRPDSLTIKLFQIAQKIWHILSDPLIEFDFGLITNLHKSISLKERYCSNPLNIDNMLPSKEKPLKNFRTS